MPPDPPSPPVTSSALPIDLRRVPWAAPLVRDYCHDYDRLASFYTGAPADRSRWKDAIEQRQTPLVNPRRVGEVVGAQLRARQAPAAALAGADQLGEQGTVAVLTGQQAGLFGGPVYTLLKALTAVALARRVAAEHHVRTVPVFWVDAEDHDLDEIRTCSVLDAELSPRTVSLELPKSGQPAAAVVLPASIANAIGELGRALPQTEFSTEVLAGLAAAYTEGAGIVEAFSRWLDSVLGGHGLVVFDASDAAAKPLVAPIFEHELRLRGETSRLAVAAGDALTARGYHAQVTPAADAVALFQVDGAREAIRLRAESFAVGEATVPTDVLLDQLHARPASFSPNVLLRPIVQDALFPTVAYVAGPSELAYLGQLREAYAQFGVPMPVMYPRLTATLVDRATVRFLHKHDVPFETLQPQDDSVLNRLVTAQLPAALDRAVAAAEREIGERLETIEVEVPAVDPTLTGAVQTTRDRLEKDLRSLRGKIVQAAKRRDDTLRRQFHRARAQAFPGGEPQERAVAGVYFLNRYGTGLVDHLLDQLPLDIGHHWLLTV